MPLQRKQKAQNAIRPLQRPDRDPLNRRAKIKLEFAAVKCRKEVKHPRAAVAQKHRSTFLLEDKAAEGSSAEPAAGPQRSNALKYWRFSESAQAFPLPELQGRFYPIRFHQKKNKNKRQKKRECSGFWDFNTPFAMRAAAHGGHYAPRSHRAPTCPSGPARTYLTVVLRN